MTGNSIQIQNQSAQQHSESSDDRDKSNASYYDISGGGRFLPRLMAEIGVVGRKQKTGDMPEGIVPDRFIGNLSNSSVLYT